MPGAGLTIAQRVRSLLGAGTPIDTSGSVPRVAPRTEEACAILLRAAADHGWRLRIEGRAGWMPPDAPADLAVSTQALATVRDVSAADLVATVDAGVAWSELRRALADRGAWLAVDPPGDNRTIGSVVATGTAGPLRTGFGPVRDHLLGLTLITGDGRSVRAGGRVVKNVAGYDLTKLATGSFGMFGLVTSVHLRLRAVPRADLTLTAAGHRDTLWQAGRAILAAGEPVAAAELFARDPAAGDEWTLAIRLVGSEATVDAARHAAIATAPIGFREHTGTAAADSWRAAQAGASTGPVTLRLGTLPAALAVAADLLARHLDSGWTSVSVGAGSLRWSGAASPERLRLLRHAAAQVEMPLTLERAPWTVREAVGIFGAYREGIAPLTASLRRAFDPASVLVVAGGSGE